MLMIITSMKQLNICQLLDVYREDIENNVYSNDFAFTQNNRVIEAEQDFLDYMGDFFKLDGAILCVWEQDGVYMAALRIEPYKDGYLIAGLETKPTERRKGYGKKLLRATMEYMRNISAKRIYSHIKNTNVPSFQLHKVCGFSVIQDCAVLLDGSVFTNYSTLCYEY